jgi:hypothetical protein
MNYGDSLEPTDPRVVHRCKNGSFVAQDPKDRLFYVFQKPLFNSMPNEYHWTFAYRYKSRAVADARRWP